MSLQNELKELKASERTFESRIATFQRKYRNSIKEKRPPEEIETWKGHFDNAVAQEMERLQRIADVEAAIELEANPPAPVEAQVEVDEDGDDNEDSGETEGEAAPAPRKRSR